MRRGTLLVAAFLAATAVCQAEEGKEKDSLVGAKLKDSTIL
jgi:hypothetical protein